jgi:hypothetical protein
MELLVKREPGGLEENAMDRRSIYLMFCVLVYACASLAQNPKEQIIPELLPRDQEMKLALSAAPAHLREAAGVYVLEKNGFVKVRDTSNGFTCIVNRDHPLNQKPTCYDAEGSATILPKVLRFGELLMQGKPLTEIRAEIQKGFESGKFISPRRPGVAYMLSGDIKAFNPQTGQVGTFPPHVMFYAPNLTNSDIGSDGNFDPGMPSIAYQGPQGFMVVVLGDSHDAAQHQ